MLGVVSLAWDQSCDCHIASGVTGKRIGGNMGLFLTKHAPKSTGGWPPTREGKFLARWYYMSHAEICSVLKFFVSH